MGALSLVSGSVLFEAEYFALYDCRYSGNIFLWEIETSSLIKSWEVCELPVRSCKFIARRSQFICASGG